MAVALSRLFVLAGLDAVFRIVTRRGVVDAFSVLNEYVAGRFYQSLIHPVT